MKKRNRVRNLAVRAQQRIEEVTIDFGSEFASYYRHQIEDLCEEILDNIEIADEKTLAHAEENLHHVLYELSGKVRQQYYAELNIDPKLFL